MPTSVGQGAALTQASSEHFRGPVCSNIAAWQNEQRLSSIDSILIATSATEMASQGTAQKIRLEEKEQQQ